MLNEHSRLLVVDDSCAMRKIVSRMLMEFGLRMVDHADDGTSALQLLKLRRYDLVISDWSMAPMNGLELLRTIRSSWTSSSTDFIMMTGRSLKFAEVAREGQVFRFLVKPFTRRQLFECLKADGEQLDPSLSFGPTVAPRSQRFVC